MSRLATVSLDHLVARLEILRGYHRAGGYGYGDAGPLAAPIVELQDEIERRVIAAQHADDDTDQEVDTDE